MFTHVNHTFQELCPELEVTTTPQRRTYKTPEGLDYPSVTTVLGDEKKKSLQEWRDRVGEKAANEVSALAARRGENIHLMAEKYLNNDPTWKKGVMPINLFTFNDMKKTLDNNIDNIIMQEVPLYSDRLKTAGRVDLIADYARMLSIIDFKTSRRAKDISWIENYFVQTSFYAAAFFERTGVAVKQGVVIIVNDDGGCQVFKINTFDYLSKFMSLRSAYALKHNI